jgi:trehalose 6-phosphate phosphatase
VISKDRGKSHLSGAELAKWRRMPRAPSRRGTRRLFDRWAEVAGRLRAASHLALFLDFDGTLVGLRRSPGQVWLDDSVRRILRRLARHPRVDVWIVSGRRLADLWKRAAVAGVKYVGLHGWERPGRASAAKATKSFLQSVRRLAAERLSGLPGIWVEDKGFSFVVHYRGADARAVQRARAVFRQTLKPLESRLRVLEGKKVWEVLPREVEGKGAAVREVLAGLPGATLALYVGDDTTDELAFAALPRGITVRVGVPRRSRARFRLRNPEEVREFLERLEAEIA